MSDTFSKPTSFSGRVPGYNSDLSARNYLQRYSPEAYGKSFEIDINVKKYANTLAGNVCMGVAWAGRDGKVQELKETAEPQRITIFTPAAIWTYNTCLSSGSPTPENKTKDVDVSISNVKTNIFLEPSDIRTLMFY